MVKMKNVVALMLGSAIVGAAISSAKQEHDTSYPQTRTWIAGEYPRSFGSSTTHTLRVIDTAGVCLYVLDSRGTWEPHFVAVPKTQLPKGAGCQ